MALEVGAKAGIVAPAGLPDAYACPDWLRVEDGARYERIIEVDLDALEPADRRADTVDNVVDLRDLGRVAVDVVYLGTCTNGRHADMAAAARILQGRHVAPGVRMMVVPASSEALQAAIADGTLDDAAERGRDNRHARLRRVHRPAYGRAGARRDLPVHRQPQLPRAHGRAGGGHLPRPRPKSPPPPPSPGILPTRGELEALPA